MRAGACGRRVEVRGSCTCVTVRNNRLLQVLNVSMFMGGVLKYIHRNSFLLFTISSIIIHQPESPFQLYLFVIPCDSILPIFYFITYLTVIIPANHPQSFLPFLTEGELSLYHLTSVTYKVFLQLTTELK